MDAFGDQIGMGGDTSVRWNVDVRKPRKGTVESRRGDNGGAHQQGIAETPEGDFTIAIKLPRSSKARRTFLRNIRAAVRKPEQNRIIFTLPIERGNMSLKTGKVSQIRVGWPSMADAEPAPGKSRSTSRKKAR